MKGINQDVRITENELKGMAVRIGQNEIGWLKQTTGGRCDVETLAGQRKLVPFGEVREVGGVKEDHKRLS